MQWETLEPALVTDEHSGSTPFYLGLSFLKANSDASVVIFTPIQEVYEESDDEQTTKLCIDEWLVQNGNRGKVAKLLNQIQIV